MPDPLCDVIWLCQIISEDYLAWLNAGGAQFIADCVGYFTPDTHTHNCSEIYSSVKKSSAAWSFEIIFAWKPGQWRESWCWVAESYQTNIKVIIFTLNPFKGQNYHLQHNHFLTKGEREGQEARRCLIWREGPSQISEGTISLQLLILSEKTAHLIS